MNEIRKLSGASLFPLQPRLTYSKPDLPFPRLPAVCFRGGSRPTGKLSSFLLHRAVAFAAPANRAVGAAGPGRPRADVATAGVTGATGIGAPGAATAGAKGVSAGPIYATSMSDGTKTGRRRRSSSIIYKEPLESLEQLGDQAVLPNLNATWVNAKGTLNVPRGDKINLPSIKIRRGSSDHDGHLSCLHSSTSPRC